MARVGLDSALASSVALLLLAIGTSTGCDEASASPAPVTQSTSTGQAQPLPLPTPPPMPNAQAFEIRCNSCAGSCAVADADACYQLGVLYDSGQAVGQDKQRAKGLFERAARAGHVQAKTRLRASWGF